MGSKNLKAICIRGKGAVCVAEMKGFLDYVRETTTTSLMTEDNKWAHTDGTPILVEVTNTMGIHPTRNFQEGTFDAWEKIDSASVKSIKKDRGLAMLVLWLAVALFGQGKPRWKDRNMRR